MTTPFIIILFILIFSFSSATGDEQNLFGDEKDGMYFAETKKACQNEMLLQRKLGLSEKQCSAFCANASKCTALQYDFHTSGKLEDNMCHLFLRCDVEHQGVENCLRQKGTSCIYKKKRSVKMDSHGRRLNGSAKYVVKSCVTNKVGAPCNLVKLNDLYFTKQTAGSSCEDTEGQGGSITYADLILPTGSVLYIEVQTQVLGQTTDGGFFVRPTRLTRNWGKAEVTSKKASFYLAGTGQFSVEFASDAIWRNKKQATTFDALMLFVNPPITLPNNLIPISPDSKGKFFNLGPNKKYLFAAGINYDWGKDYVFKVHDNTEVYFEKGAYVRARIVQTEKKVKNVLIQGYGTLDVHYDLEPDVVGISDDATRQNIGIFGKNIMVMGVTLINTNKSCGIFGYCLNINANWSPLANKDDPFDAWELQLKDPPYKFRQAHCQENNMDDSPNTDFTNCPTSHEDGQKVSFVKCMTWQLGRDGLNAGKWGTVEKSFVRTVDDAIKPWDSHGIYRDITIWQLTLGWPINFGWWNWNQPDINTVLDSIYVIHNHNWVTSSNWPENESGQCIVGGIYGSGAVKQGYRLSNIYVETAASCAIGLQIDRKAYSRHPTPEGCVGSMIDMRIENMYFDEEFYQKGGYNNYLSGETKPKQGCVGDLRGEINSMQISGLVAGRSLSRSDFIVDDDTVSGLVFKDAPDPNESNRDFKKYDNKNAYDGNGGTEIDVDGVKVLSVMQCLDRCESDWSCECAVFSSSDSLCYKRGKCSPEKFDSDGNYDVYMRQFSVSQPPVSTPTESPKCKSCSNKPWKKGKSCEKDLNKKKAKKNCKNKKKWRKKLFCEKRCFEFGQGYEQSNCC